MNGRLAKRQNPSSLSATDAGSGTGVSVSSVMSFAISIFIEAWRRKYNDKQPKKGLGGLVEKIRIREVSFRSLFRQRRQLDLQAMEAEAVTMGAQAARAVWTYEALGFPRAGDYSLVLFR